MVDNSFSFNDLESGISVCEVGANKGFMLEWLAKKYPKSTFTGVDIEESFVQAAREKFAEKKLDITMIRADASDLPDDLTQKFDHVLLVCCFHDFAYPSKAAKEFYRILKPWGILSLIDPKSEENPHNNVGNSELNIQYFYSFYDCLSTSMYYPESEGLGALPGTQKLQRIVEKAGFTAINHDIKYAGASFNHCMATK